MTRPHLIALGWLLVGVASVTWAQATVEDDAKTSAQGVKDLYGTEEKLSANGFEPLSTDKPMQTVNGQPFDAQMTCPASQRFLRVTLFPNATSDIANFTVDLDADLDGTVESSTNFPGPYAGVCANGVIRCDAGTF